MFLLRVLDDRFLPLEQQRLAAFLALQKSRLGLLDLQIMVGYGQPEHVLLVPFRGGRYLRFELAAGLNELPEIVLSLLLLALSMRLLGPEQLQLVLSLRTVAEQIFLQLGLPRVVFELRLGIVAQGSANLGTEGSASVHANWYRSSVAGEDRRVRIRGQRGTGTQSEIGSHERGAFAGRTVQLPVQAGLLSLNAASGLQAETELLPVGVGAKAEQSLLRNPLALEGEASILVGPTQGDALALFFEDTLLLFRLLLNVEVGISLVAGPNNPAYSQSVKDAVGAGRSFYLPAEPVPAETRLGIYGTLVEACHCSRGIQDAKRRGGHAQGLPSQHAGGLPGETAQAALLFLLPLAG